MKIRINLTEAKAIDPKKKIADKKAEDKKKADAKKVAEKKVEDKKKEDKKKADAKKKLKESLYPMVKGMLAEVADIEDMPAMEEDTLNEIDPGSIDWSTVAAAMGAIGLAPVLIDKIHTLWKKKFPESFKKAQGVSGAMDRQVGGNAPGDKDRQIKPGQF
jgi:hypothetical protein